MLLHISQPISFVLSALLLHRPYKYIYFQICLVVQPLTNCDCMRFLFRLRSNHRIASPLNIHTTTKVIVVHYIVSNEAIHCLLFSRSYL